MKLRITGMRAECDALVAVLTSPVGLAVREVSEFYPNRGASNLGRVYLEIAPPEIAPPEIAAPAEPGLAAESAGPAHSARRRVRRARQPGAGRER